MKIFQIMFGLALVGTLAACTPEKAANNAKDMTYGAMETMEKSSDAMMDEAENMVEDAMEKTGELMEKAEENVTALSAASYVEYSATAGAGKKHLLFFYADWCPTCVKWEAKVTEALATLPEDTLILKASYDDDAELKAQYEIVKQSTAVFINADGSVAKTESDPSVESLTAFFQ